MAMLDAMCSQPAVRRSRNVLHGRIPSNILPLMTQNDSMMITARQLTGDSDMTDNDDQSLMNMF